MYRQSVKVTPTAEGVLLLGLTVSLKHDEMTESRVFSIPHHRRTLKLEARACPKAL